MAKQEKNKDRDSVTVTIKMSEEKLDAIQYTLRKQKNPTTLDEEIQEFCEKLYQKVPAALRDYIDSRSNPVRDESKPKLEDDGAVVLSADALSEQSGQNNSNYNN